MLLLLFLAAASAVGEIRPLLVAVGDSRAPPPKAEEGGWSGTISELSSGGIIWLPPVSGRSGDIICRPPLSGISLTLGLCQRRWEARLAGQLNTFSHSGHLYSRLTIMVHLCMLQAYQRFIIMLNLHIIQ